MMVEITSDDGTTKDTDKVYALQEEATVERASFKGAMDNSSLRGVPERRAPVRGAPERRMPDKSMPEGRAPDNGKSAEGMIKGCSKAIEVCLDDGWSQGLPSSHGSSGTYKY